MLNASVLRLSKAHKNTLGNLPPTQQSNQEISSFFRFSYVNIPFWRPWLHKYKARAGPKIADLSPFTIGTISTAIPSNLVKAIGCFID